MGASLFVIYAPLPSTLLVGKDRHDDERFGMPPGAHLLWAQNIPPDSTGCRMKFHWTLFPNLCLSGGPMKLNLIPHPRRVTDAILPERGIWDVDSTSCQQGIRRRKGIASPSFVSPINRFIFHSAGIPNGETIPPSTPIIYDYEHQMMTVNEIVML